MDSGSNSLDGGNDSATCANSVPPTPYQGFSLATLLLVVTLVSIICGLSVLAPGLGLAAAIVSLPALVRTALVTRHSAAGLNPNRMSSVLSLFFASLGFVVMFGTAAGICCYGTCWGGFLAGSAVGQLWESGDYAGLGSGLVLGFGLGGIVACLLGYVAMTRLPDPLLLGRLSRTEKVIVAGAVFLAVVGGFVLFFRVINW